MYVSLSTFHPTITVRSPVAVAAPPQKLLTSHLPQERCSLGSDVLVDQAVEVEVHGVVECQHEVAPTGQNYRWRVHLSCHGLS